MIVFMRWLMLCFWLYGLVACSGAPPAASTPAIKSITTPKMPDQSNQRQDEKTASRACPLAEATWIKPPEDAAVQNSPEFGYYFVNKDRSIWASAWWVDQEEYPLRASKEGVKVGWFRPAGTALEITGRRLDGPAPPMESHVPCCYPTRFQATGLIFPTEGCWEVTAQAAASELAFVVWVEP